MPLNPSDIATLSRLLDAAMELPAAEREAWLAAMPGADAHLAASLREMLAREAELDSDPQLLTMPRLADDGSVAQPGDRVGPYRLLREIGRGGMGSVWLSERADGSFKRQVALKLPRLAWGAGLAKRMARERDIGALLEHPNIARMYDAGVDEHGRPFLALEFIDGQPIDAWCEAQGLDARSRLRLFAQVAMAVAYAHGRLVVHRDLKPSNVLVTPDGQAHLLDFGIAKLLDEAVSAEAGLTQQQGRVLTPHYASPEQVAGEVITVQSDVYSLGVLLYELLTGTLPIAPKRSTAGAVEEAILEGHAPPASSRAKDRVTAKALRGEVDAILAKAMQREPARRYTSAEALAQDIERHLRGETVAARPDSATYRLRKALRRHALVVSAASAVALAVLGGSGVAVMQARRAADAAERARVVKEFVTEVFRINTLADDGGLRQQPAEQLLAHGAQLIDSRFPQQPVLRAELLGVVGGIYAQMGAHRLAADFKRRQLVVLDTLGPDRVEHVQVMLQLAEALLNDRATAQALKVVGEALQRAEGDELLTYDGLVMMLRCQSRAGSRDLSSATLKKVQAMEQRLDVRGRIAHAWALQAEANVLDNDNRGDAGIEMHDRAIVTAQRIEGPRSRAAAAMRLSTAYLLMSLNRWEDADRHFDAALSVLRSTGQAGEARATLALITRESVLAQYGRRSAVTAAAAMTEQLATLRRWKAVVPAEVFADAEMDLVLVNLVGGNLESARAGLDGISTIVHQEANRLSLHAWTTAAAYAAAMAGEPMLAEALGRQALALRLATGSGGVQFAVVDHMGLVHNMILAGRAADAEAYLDAMPAVAAVKGDMVAGDDYTHLPMQARALSRLARGDPAGALRALRARADILPGDDDGSEPPQRNANVTRGWLWCELGEPARGLEAMAQAEAQRVRYAFAQDPGLAWLRGREGLCALRLGRQAEAKRLAALAREAFNRQPGVSPFYKVPLFELERALGLQLPPI